jgi:hypothetical protein
MIGKVGVEAAKKGVTMAGQKLSEFFAKEGIKKAAQQAGQVFSKEGINQAGNVATQVGKQIMRAPEAVKAGAQAVGEAASQAAGQVGKEAVRTGIKLGGKAGGQGVKNIGMMATSPFAVQTGIGVAAEQVVPRLMGQEPRSGLGESILRQGVSQGVGMPVSAGLMAGGVNPMIATFGGQVAGQIAGQTAADALLPGKQVHPLSAYGELEDRYMDNQMSPQQERQFEDLDRQMFGAGPKSPTGATKHTAEPEFTQVVRPSTSDLSGVQAREALSERDKYEYRLKLAQIEKMPSTVMHMSPDSAQQSLNSLAQSMMSVARY